MALPRVRIWLDGVEIKAPLQADFQVSNYLVTDMIRNAAATMNGQILSRKIKLFFKYPAISGAELYKIYSILQNPPLFHNVTFILDGIRYERTMYVGEMPQTLSRTGAGIGSQSTWIWKDVNFNLIER